MARRKEGTRRHSQGRTLGDRYRARKGAEIKALGGVPAWQHEQEVRKAVDAALMEAENQSLDEITVGIGSAESFLTARGVMHFDDGMTEYQSGNVYETHFTGTPQAARKSHGDKKEHGVSRQLGEGDEETWGDETITPPWDLNVMQSLLATSTVHAAAIETKAADFSYSGWALKIREEVVALGISDEELAQERAKVTAFIRGISEDGCSVEEFARDLSIQYESLGMMSVEPIRNRAAMISSYKIMPFRTARVLSQKCEAYAAGARYVQQRGDRKRYFTKLGDNIKYASPDFDPDTSMIEKFPRTKQQRESFVQWADTLVRADRPRTSAQITRSEEDQSIDFENAASELLVYARRPFTVSETYGTPAGVQALSSMLALRKIEEYNLQFFESKGVPQYAVVIKGLSSKQRPGSPGRVGAVRTKDMAAQVTQAVTKFFTENIRKADRSVLVVQLTGDVEITFEKLSSDSVEASFAEYEKRMREDIRLAHRIPPAALGINEEKANIGSGRDGTQMKRYRDHIVAPGQRTVAAFINTLIRHATLIPYFDFVFTPVDIEDDSELRKLWLEMYKVAALELDELRRRMPGDNPEYGAEPDEAGEGGQGGTRILPTSYQVVGGSTGDAAAVLEGMIAKQARVLQSLNQHMINVGLDPRDADPLSGERQGAT